LAGFRGAVRNRFAPKPLLGIASVMLLFSFFWKSGCLQKNGFHHETVKHAENQIFLFHVFKEFGIFELFANYWGSTNSAFIR